jgi:hypothetical protein
MTELSDRQRCRAAGLMLSARDPSGNSFLSPVDGRVVDASTAIRELEQQQQEEK